MYRAQLSNNYPPKSVIAAPIITASVIPGAHELIVPVDSDKWRVVLQLNLRLNTLQQTIVQSSLLNTPIVTSGWTTFGIIVPCYTYLEGDDTGIELYNNTAVVLSYVGTIWYAEGNL
jgi:hypothetical protein